MKFGLWDHVDASGRPFTELLDNRLEFVAAADELGYYCYHVAEHHATPLNLVPVPGVYLGAVAQATRDIKLGPLVYLLPLYSPLRLIEEICILDQLSHGRLQVGVGRGVSPYELGYHKIDPEESREIMVEALETVLYGLTHERLDHHGKHFDYADVPMELEAFQKPHPPIWYASSNPESSKWAGEMGYHMATLGPVALAKACVGAFREAYNANGTPAVANDDFPGGAAMGAVRHMVIADTDADALKIAGDAYDYWYLSLTKLERNNVAGPRITKNMPTTAAAAIELGSVVVGTPDSVTAKLREQIAEIGLNYLIAGFAFGSLSHESAMRSLKLFASDVRPQLEDL